MNNPDGYTALDLVGYTDQGDYNATKSYVANDLVHYGGSIWCCLIDDTVGITPTEGVNWRFWVEDSQNGISDIVNVLGAKNLIPFPYSEKAITREGVTYTVIDDGGININGASTGYSYFTLMRNSSLKLGDYILSNNIALPQNGLLVLGYTNRTTYVFEAKVYLSTLSTGVTITDEWLDNAYVELRFIFDSGAVADNITVYPMLRLASIKDDTYVPYAKTNKELTEEVTQNSSDIQTLTNQTEENTEDIATNLVSINILKNNGNWRTGLRFKNLGTSFTAEQATALANGDFSEFWNGDYWVINSQTWRIVDNSGWARRRGDTNFDSNSLVVMPDSNLVTAEAYLIDGGTSGSNVDTHGYANCGYRADEKSGKGRTQCRTLFQNAFGSSHIASHRELMSTSRGTGGALSWAWQDTDVELPSEVNIYGHSVWGSGLEGGVDEPSFNIGDRWGQFMLFRLAPYRAINRGQNYWLRDIHSASNFACVGNLGNANFAAPSFPLVGLRPYSIIK